jgi:hypothetical protein
MKCLCLVETWCHQSCPTVTAYKDVRTYCQSMWRKFCAVVDCARPGIARDLESPCELRPRLSFDSSSASGQVGDPGRLRCWRSPTLPDVRLTNTACGLCPYLHKERPRCQQKKTLLSYEHKSASNEQIVKTVYVLIIALLWIRISRIPQNIFCQVMSVHAVVKKYFRSDNLYEIRAFFFKYCCPCIMQWFLVNDQRDAQFVRHVGHLPRNTRCFGILHSVKWYFLTDVSGQPTCSIFNPQEDHIIYKHSPEVRTSVCIFRR